MGVYFTSFASFTGSSQLLMGIFADVMGNTTFPFIPSSVRHFRCSEQGQRGCICARKDVGQCDPKIESNRRQRDKA